MGHGNIFITRRYPMFHTVYNFNSKISVKTITRCNTNMRARGDPLRPASSMATSQRATSAPPTDRQVVKPLPKLRIHGPRPEGDTRSSSVGPEHTQTTEDGNPQPETRIIPVFSQLTNPESPANNPTSSSHRSMGDQTAASFNARGPDPPISRSGSEVLGHSSPAPSDVEVYRKVGLVSPGGKEVAKDHHKRSNANELKLAVWVLQHQMAIDRLDSDEAQHYKDILRRLADIQRGQPATAMMVDGVRLDDIVLENRDAIGNLTETVNDLQDMRDQFESFRRETRKGLESAARIRPPDSAGAVGVRRRLSPDREQGPSNKRARGDEEGREKDRHSDRHDRDNNDVLLWSLKDARLREREGAKNAANKALMHVGMDPNLIFSVRHITNAASSGTISLRFRDYNSADVFIQKIRNGPAGMEKLNAEFAPTHGKGKKPVSARRNQEDNSDFW
ncbi:hypothetical protein DFH09DRAFT_1130886 [Mycena vulgaris]|nr:hypothetical protein DFH09DRAFT_1130886 [Mycena vulgaris]